MTSPKAERAKETYREVGTHNCGNCGHMEFGIRSQSSFAIRNRCHSNWCPILAEFVRGSRTTCNEWEQA